MEKVKQIGMGSWLWRMLLMLKQTYKRRDWMEFICRERSEDDGKLVTESSVW